MSPSALFEDPEAETHAGPHGDELVGGVGVPEEVVGRERERRGHTQTVVVRGPHRQGVIVIVTCGLWDLEHWFMVLYGFCGAHVLHLIISSGL